MTWSSSFQFLMCPPPIIPLWYSLSLVPPQDGSEVVAKKTKSSLSPEGSLHKVPRLEKQFKKPPPLRNRRKPSKGHLHQLAADCQSPGETSRLS